jgi:DNA repair exonuclease SbcCD ATPase subunit
MLTFTKIRYKNILSFGDNWTTIDLESNNSILIQGMNGAGKSAAILDTICYALYNKPFRKINKPNLINYRNKKDMIVEIWFTSESGDQFHVVRGMAPQIFEIYKNGEMFNQNSAIRDYQDFFEKTILKIDFHSFTQMVMLGKATHIAFLKMPLQDRRRFIDNVLNLNIFSVMTEVNKSKTFEVKTNLQEIKVELGLMKQRIELTQKHIKDFEQEALRQQKDHERQIDEQINSIHQMIATLEEERKQKEAMIQTVDEDISKLSKDLEKCYEYQTKLNSKLSQIKKRIKFFSDNEICPTCENVLDSSVRETKLAESEMRERDLEQGQNQLSEKTEILVQLVKKIQNQMSHNNTIQQSIQLIDHTIQQKLSQISEIEARRSFQNTGNEDKIQEKKDELQSLIERREEKNEERSQLNAKMQCYEFITLMLKDTGIKSIIIRKYIPKIVAIMNEFLKELDLFVKFDLNENFEETLLARGIDELDYQSFSEGEKLRIDLAMLMTWREICKLQNNMNVNFLIFDEILDASLDEGGAESLVQMFKKMTRNGNKIMVISHGGARWEEKFDETWFIEKSLGFSQITK